MELFVKICLKIKKNIFEILLKLFVKKMSFIISLVVLFICSIINLKMNEILDIKLVHLYNMSII